MKYQLKQSLLVSKMLGRVIKAKRADLVGPMDGNSEMVIWINKKLGSKDYNETYLTP